MKQLKYSIRGQGKLLRDSSFSKHLLKNGVKAGFPKLCAIQLFPCSLGSRSPTRYGIFLPRNKHHGHDLRRLINTSCQFRGKQ